jgi:hypothetical protein
MAYFAKLDSNNKVLEVVAVANSVMLDQNNTEREELGVAFLVQWSGGHPYWKQTSYNGTIRKNFAGIDYTYDASKNAFIPPQPYPSWVLDSDTYNWQPPVAHPQDNKLHRWDEQTKTWKPEEPIND